MKNLKISVIIPTYNRASEIEATLSSLLLFLDNIQEVIIVDQSTNNKTKKLIEKMQNKKIKYVYSKIPSIPIARNIGVSHISKKTQLICFLDDDVSIFKGYFEEIRKVFEENSEAKLVAGWISSPEHTKLENLLKKLFFLGYLENKDSARIISVYGNTYPRKLTKTTNVQWTPGVNMCFKRDVFDEQKFDENFLGYALGEDIDFTYRLWKKYPKGVFLTPNARIIHRASQIERKPTEVLSYINQVDHFYFYFKNLRDSLKYRLLFFWNIFGISILRIAQFLLKPNKDNGLKLKFFFKSLFYCIKNSNKIKKGILRDFIKNG